MSDYRGVTQTFVFIVKNRGSTFNEDPQIVQVEVMTRGTKWFVDEPIASPLNNEPGKLQVTGISPWTPLDSPGRLFAARDGSDVLDIYSACSSFQHFDVNANGGRGDRCLFRRLFIFLGCRRTCCLGWNLGFRHRGLGRFFLGTLGRHFGIHLATAECA